MRYEDFEQFVREPGLGTDEDQGVLRSSVLASMETGAAPIADAGMIEVEELPPQGATARPQPLMADIDFGHEWGPEYDGPFAAAIDEFTSAALSPEDIDPAQILRERPDVYAAFYRDFYGSNNDRNSPAWVDRVGGDSPEDYARYWYNSYGRFEGYTPGTGGPAAPAEGASEPSQGRTTIDGIPLSKILSDRPDVFQAFFTEYYGPQNDRHSDAWVQRVGGTTVEDYANYWYNAFGKVGGYTPSAPPGATPELPPATSGEVPADNIASDQMVADVEIVPADPATIPDALGLPEEYTLARPLVIHYTDDGFELLPATHDEIIALRTLFDDMPV